MGSVAGKDAVSPFLVRGGPPVNALRSQVSPGSDVDSIGLVGPQQYHGGEREIHHSDVNVTVALCDQPFHTAFECTIAVAARR